VLRFAGFELDQQRAELRGADSAPIKLRPKAFDLLILFAANPGRILSKQELMDAVWPNIHVGEDSLFQCIRELRTALGDDQRQIVKLVSGRGYIFDAEVLNEPDGAPKKAAHALAVPEASAAPPVAAVPPTRPVRLLRGPVAAAVALVALVGLAIAAPLFWPPGLPKRAPIVAVMPIAEAGQDAETAAMAAQVTGRLIDGLVRIDILLW